MIRGGALLGGVAFPRKAKPEGWRVGPSVKGEAFSLAKKCERRRREAPFTLGALHNGEQGKSGTYIG